MNKYFFLIVAIVFNSCFVPKREAVMRVCNLTDEAIYVQYASKEQLQLSPKLEFFVYNPERVSHEGALDPYYSPRYRINAHNSGLLSEKWKSSKRWIPFPDSPEIDYVYFFFIKESTMKLYSWNEIVTKQLYEKRIKYTYDELEKLNYEILYNPLASAVLQNRANKKEKHYIE